MACSVCIQQCGLWSFEISKNFFNVFFLHICHTEEKSRPCVANPFLWCIASWRSKVQRICSCGSTKSQWLYKPLVCSEPAQSVRAFYSPQVIPLTPGHWLCTLSAWEPLEHKQRPNFASCLCSRSPSSQSDPFALSSALCHAENGPKLLLILIMLWDRVMWCRFYTFALNFSMHQMFCLCPRDNTVI